jgi:thioredoxin 1
MNQTSDVVTANDDNFDREVLAADGPVLVDFGATWCGPCRALEPIVSAVAAEREGRLKVVTVDIDDAPEVVRRYGVRSAPTLMVFASGAKRAQHVGLLDKRGVLALVDREG